MPVPSLLSLCRKACIKNVHSTAFTDVGDLQYNQISDILSFLRSPEQLHQIEEQSPQIKGLDAELWQKFIAKEVPKWAAKNYAPKNPLKWYEVYKRYKREQAEEIKRDEETLRETMMGIKKARDNNLSKVVDLGSLPKLPRDPRMLANNGGVPLSRSSFKKETPSTLRFAAASKIKMNDGQSVLTRARREAKEIAKMGKLSRPTHQLSIGRVSKAPAAMVKEYRTANQPAIRILSRRMNSQTPGIKDTALEDRENRLRSLTAGSNAHGAQPNYVDSEDEFEEADELFNDSPSSSATLSQKKHTQAAILSTKKNTVSRMPSRLTTATIPNIAATPSSRAMYQRNLSNLAGCKVASSPSLATKKTPQKMSISNNDTGVVGSKASIPSTTANAKIALNKRNKQTDIFNRGSAKRSRC
ncbi:BgTH12-05933 [Blumeria graminis f. sp. triticale]|uniref:Bgt-2406 n=3 Tax=Blumeria graminis TaxID=34373 RepID=A0A061HLX0_BLUGR|nr:hypothetical protein BGT96224_2406 [Blumeria graminis f. sp. tritici 96224]CAD6504199.1 BgTH12-05933 [Blumeria graminis f. sp. triticale]VDB90988.1 Bgt-2406 [Blumeria graminis f. sp. tritici]